MEQRSAHPTQHDPYGRYEPDDPYAARDTYTAQDTYATSDPYSMGDPYSTGDPYGTGDPYQAYDAYEPYERYRVPEGASRRGSGRGGRGPAGDGRRVGPRGRAHSPRLPRPVTPAPSGDRAPARPAAGARAAPRQASDRARTPARPSGQRRGRLPAPRLTGLGVGVFSSLLMAAFGGLSGLLPGGAPGFYGSVFVLVCAAAALWVRPAELFAAPVAVPLAYTVGQLCAGGPGDGVTGMLQNLFTSLALHAVWLYAGTLLAVLLVLVRKTVLMVRRRRQRRLTSG